ncbi:MULTISPECIES: hypothetical protein [unclassified Breznakia]|uniref:hypothetical protein n=1 Tax=unclassified Breznakia TaxID=2623764 RepID=UPI002406CD03|nr:MULTISPECIES: hypothetical protein [unclassified Breznakia]
MRRKYVKTLKMFKRCFLTALALGITLTAINLPKMDIHAQTEDVRYDLQTELSEDKKELRIDLLAYANRNDVEITAIGNPDGTITDGAKTSYVSVTNETLTFVVNYKILEEKDGKIKEISKTKEVEYEVDQFGKEEEAQPQALSDPLAPFSSLKANMSFRNAFNVSHTKDGLYYLSDNSMELGYHYNEYVKFLLSKARCTTSKYWEGWYAKFAAVSKYKVDFSKDFKVTNVISSNPTLYGDGFTLGFQTDPNFTYTTGKGGSIGVYRNGSDYGARNGVVFEVDYHDNSPDGMWHDIGLGGNHLAIHTTDAYGNESTPVASWFGVKHTGSLTAFNVTWTITDKATNTGTLTFTYGTYNLKYTNFRPHEVFGGSVNNPTAAYLTYTGVILKDYGSNNKPFQITMTDYSYLEDEVTASDGFITQTQAKALANQNGLILYNNASAVSTAGDSVTPTVSTPAWSNIKSGLVGTYDVTYAYGTASKTVKLSVIKDGSIISPNKDFSLYAENASLLQSEAIALSSMNDLVSVHDASVTMANGTLLAPNATTSAWSSIKAGVVGNYVITFYYGTGSNYTAKNVTLSVVADKKHEIYASDGFITQSQAKALTSMQGFIPYNQAKVITNEGVTTVPSTVATNYWNEINTGTIGSYNVTYSYGSGTARVSKTVKLNVVKDGTVFPPDNSFALYAEDGFIKQSQAKALTSTSQLIPYNNASVTLADGSSDVPFVSLNTWSNIVSGTIGSYDIVYMYGAGANLKYKVVKLNVIEDGGIIAPDKSFALYADNGTISQTQASALTGTSQLIPYNNAKVILANGTRAEPNVSAPTYSEIVSGVVKTHKVTYSYGVLTNKVSKEVDLQLIADKRHEVRAEDGFIYATQAKALTNQSELIPFNSASVITNTGQSAQPVVTTGSWANIVAGVTGSYDITYSYGSGTTQGSKTVVLNVVPDGTIFPPDKAFAVYAEDGLINVEQAKKLTAQKDLIPYNSAYVMLKNGTIVDPDVSTWDWVKISAGIEGTYDVNYGYTIMPNTVQKGVKLTVTKGTTPPSNSFSLYARDGFVYEDQAKAFTAQKDMIPFNDAFVTLKDGSSVDPQVATPHWSAIKDGTIGSYPVTYGYTKGSESLSSVVKLNVVENGSTISPGQDFAIYAKNGIIQQSSAQALISLNDLIPYNGAKVTLKDGSEATPTVTTADWTAIRAGVLGTYSITYSYGSGTNTASKVVTLRVVPDGNPSPEGDFILYASNGFISKEQAMAITSQKDLIPYNKASVIKDDGSDAEPSVSTTSYADIKAGKLGVYNVTYRYGFGTNLVSKTVKLTVHDGTPSPGGNYVLNAKDGLISKSEAKALSSTADLIAINDASVWMNDGSTDVPVVTMLPLNWLSLNEGIINSYPVLYSYGSGSDYTQKTVRVTVYDDGGIISPNKDFVLNAKNAVLTQSEAKTLTSASDLTVYNDALVSYANGNKAIPNTTATEFASIKSGVVGTYNVTYDYGTGSNYTEKAVKLVVVKDGALIAPDRSFAIYAEDVTLNQDEARALTNKNQITSLAHAMVYIADGTTATPTLSLPDWDDIKAGISNDYAADFTYQDVTGSINIKVTQEYVTRYLFDYDNNKRIDVIDYAYFASYYSGATPMSPLAWALTDYPPGDGRIDVIDLAHFKRHYSDSTLPLVEVEVPADWRLE